MQKLTVSERARLLELEKEIKDNLPAFQRVGRMLLANEEDFRDFMKVGRALYAIRDDRLYRAEFTTWDAYCEKNFPFTGNYANRLIRACQIRQYSVPVGTVVTCERQARALISADRIAELKRKALAGLSPEDRRELIEDEEEALVHRSMPHTHGGQGRKVRMLQIERIAKRFRFLVEGLGDEVETILVKFDRVMEHIRGLPE